MTDSEPPPQNNPSLKARLSKFAKRLEQQGGDPEPAKTEVTTKQAAVEAAGVLGSNKADKDTIRASLEQQGGDTPQEPTPLDD